MGLSAPAVEAARDLKKNGVYIVFDENVNKELIRVESQLQYKLDHQSSQKYPDISTIRTYTADLDFFNQVKCLLTPKIDEILKAYFSSNYKVISAQLTRMDTNNTVSRDSSFVWHLDGYEPKSYIKVFVYLNDIKKENGAFQYLDKQDTAKMLNAGFDGRYPERLQTPPDMQVLLNKASKVVEGKKGTVFFGDVSSAIHRASMPNTGCRETLMFDVAPTAASTISYMGGLDGRRIFTQPLCALRQFKDG